MIKYKFYRNLHTFFGYRSFTKKSEDGNTTYILLRGDTDKMVKNLLEDGYVEEWPDLVAEER